MISCEYTFTVNPAATFCNKCKFDHPNIAVCRSEGFCTVSQLAIAVLAMLHNEKAGDTGMCQLMPDGAVQGKTIVDVGKCLDPAGHVLKAGVGVTNL